MGTIKQRESLKSDAATGTGTTTLSSYSAPVLGYSTEKIAETGQIDLDIIRVGTQSIVLARVEGKRLIRKCAPVL